MELGWGSVRDQRGDSLTMNRCWSDLMIEYVDLRLQDGEGMEGVNCRWA